MLSGSIRRVAARVLVLVFSGICVTMLPACETVKGAGRDIQNVGQAGSDAIDSAAGKK